MKADLKNVTNEQARKTALLVASALLVVAGILWWRTRVTSATVFGVVAVSLLIVAFVPPLAKIFHRVWMTFAFALGWVNSRIILTLIYFVVFVPYGLVSRLVGRDPLDLRQKRDSYWTPRAATRQSTEQFERLF